MKSSKSKLKNISIIILMLLTSVFCVKKYVINSKEIKTEEELIAIYEQKVKEANELINIDELSDEFMDNYFEEVGKLSSEDNKNTLIVISKEKVSNNYGAKKIIEAPNNNYYLVYDSEDKKNNAYKKLQKNSDIVSVGENIELTYDDNTSTNNTQYNSWAAKQLGYDVAINKINEIKIINPEKIKEIGVAVIDTGLNINELPEEYKKRIVHTYDVPNEDNENISDEKGHGTHVAGIIVENTPANVKITAIKSNKDTGYSSIGYVTAAINYLLNNEMNIDVINLSLGVQISSDDQLQNYTTLTQAITGAYEKNIVVVASSGNNNEDELKYPALLETVLSIGAVDSRLERTEFSNYGVGLEFVAPGFNIKSPNQQVKMGTSQAAPHASAAVAILKSLNKDITLEQSIDLLKKYAIDIGDDGMDEQYGNGVINFKGAIFCGENEIENEEESCDYGVFEKNNIDTLTTQKIESNGMFVTEYNYGNITNIMNAEIKLYYTEDDYYIKTLSQINDNIEIIGYNANEYNVQDVTIKYTNYITNKILTTTLIVDNTQIKNKDIDWNFNENEDGTIELTGIKYPNVSNVGTDTYCITTQPQVIHIPGKINGKPVTSLGENIFRINFSTGNMLRYFCTLKKVYIPKGIEKIKVNAFSIIRQSKSLNNSENNPGPVELVIPESINYIDDTSFQIYEYEQNEDGSISEPTFDSYRDNIIFYIYNNEYAKEYAESKSIEYWYLDSGDSNINIELLKDKYLAFDEINSDDLSITVNYNNASGTVSEKINNFEIKYNNENTGLRYGDDSFTVVFYTNIGHYIEKKVTGINVTKLQPEYDIPNNLNAELGQNLFDISLPKGFEWTSDNEVFNEIGSKTYKAKYTPDDIVNYEIVEDIEITINVLSNVIKYTASDYSGIYDGKEHTIDIDIDLDDYDVKYSIDNKDYNLDELPKFKEVGEYVINYKITAENYDDVYGVNKVKIYGIKSYDSTLQLKDNVLIVKDYSNSFKKISSRIDIYSPKYELKHYDKDNKIISTDLVKTGEKINININDKKEYNYIISILGDVNGDGKINYLDYVNVYNHIYKIKHIESDKKLLKDEYLLSADTSLDGKINYLDYVKIYNKIKEIKGGSR